MEVSIIIPSFNRPEWSIKAIESVLQQTYKNWHLIFIDDGSTDNTYQKVQSYLSSQKNKNYTLVKTPNLGVSHARNLGVKLSRSPWCAFLDCDDTWLPHKLNSQIQYLKSHPHCRWVYSDESWYKHDQPFAKKTCHKKVSTHFFIEGVLRCYIGASTVLIYRHFFLESGGFNENYPVCEDYDLWLRLLLKQPIGFINEELIIKNGGHEDQLSTKYKAMDYWRVKTCAQLLNQNLNQRQSQALLNFLHKKLPILIHGFKKYQNQEKLKEIKELQQQLRSNTDNVQKK